MTTASPPRRHLGLLGATGIGVGAIVGGGFLALAGIGFQATGPSAILAFALNGGIAILTVFSFAELAARFPRSGGTYAYARRVLTVEAAFAVGWVVWFASAVAAVLYAMGFAVFFVPFLEQMLRLAGNEPPAWLGDRLALVGYALCAVAFYAWRLTRFAVGGRQWETMGKVVVLVVLILAGFFALFAEGPAPGDLAARFRPFFTEGFTGLLQAMGYTFIALQGFDLIAAVGGEVRDAERNVPKAMFLSLGTALVIFLPLLFLIDPEGFAGGRIELSPELSAEAVGRNVGAVLELGHSQAAQGLVEIVDENMSNAARVLAVEEGKVASEQTIIAFGGAAPLHACRIAEKLGIQRIVVPVDAGVGSAVGFLRAPVAYEVVRSLNMRLSALDAGAVNELMADMRREARSVVESGAFGAALAERRVAYMRYLGQGHEIAVSVEAEHLGPDDGRALQAAYDREYERLFKRVIPDADVEVLSWGLTVSTAETMPAAEAGAGISAAPEPAGWRDIHDTESGEAARVPLYRRADLAAGDGLDGPALIVEEQTSTFVSRAFTAMLAPGGNIVLDRRV